MTNTNLLEETTEVLQQYNLTPRDIRWVSATLYHPDYTTTTCTGTAGDFLAAALLYNYDSGYGGQEVNDSLLIVGDDWWLERHDYDGSEWWEFKQMPTLPAKAAPWEPRAVQCEWRQTDT